MVPFLLVRCWLDFQAAFLFRANYPRNCDMGEYLVSSWISWNTSRRVLQAIKVTYMFKKILNRILQLRAMQNITHNVKETGRNHSFSEPDICMARSP